VPGSSSGLAGFFDPVYSSPRDVVSNISTIILCRDVASYVSGCGPTPRIEDCSLKATGRTTAMGKLFSRSPNDFISFFLGEAFSIGVDVSAFGGSEAWLLLIRASVIVMGSNAPISGLVM